LAFAEELGHRVGVALENAILFEAAHAAVKIRDEFLSIASHELRTPITALQLQLQMEARKQPDERLSHAFQVSLKQVTRLSALIDDLLDVSRIQRGKLSCEFADCDLSE